MKTLALTLSLALATTAFAAPMLASGGEAVSVSVRTGDLDLSSEAGVQTLYSRIRGAARRACKGVESRSASTQVEHAMCMRTAMDSGVMAANNEALTALHLATDSGASATVAAK
jgi:UrcA family protein